MQYPSSLIASQVLQSYNVVTARCLFTVNLLQRPFFGTNYAWPLKRMHILTSSTSNDCLFTLEDILRSMYGKQTPQTKLTYPNPLTFDCGIHA